MKKTLKYLLIIMVSIVIPFSVFAEKTSIKDTDIVDIKIPENYKLITKYNLNEMIKWLGYDQRKSSEYKYNWVNKSYYADIVSDSKEKEIIITKETKDFTFDDLSIYPDETILDSFSKLKKDYKGYKPVITLYSTSKGIKYDKIKYSDEENSLYSIEYLTSIHGNVYKIKYTSNSQIEDDIISNIEDILSSIEYDGYLKFIKNNKIELEEKNNNSGSTIVVIFIFLIIIAGGVVAYLKITKKKDKGNNNNVVVQEYNPVQTNPTNPAVADFLGQAAKLEQENNVNQFNESNNKEQ